ncbi:DUF1033 family protein [Sporosarcina sp. JAI121]|uniref:DUF1033 family protein n=1 Tax=Sporosarcina sp. JAI121 TaxID=2723064 RepID=UPI0015CB33F7|nr:DUF1033 family protein [Sporosarcina sp. JAI121]NYF24711.1 hypothetical protein [Sporosarcina sp. JAI121]
MFEVIYMKADYEPWWMFDEWEDTIRSRHSFDDVNSAVLHFEKLIAELRKKHKHEAVKKDCFYAFWSEDEINFCDGCDEDLQLYHGIILMKDGKPRNFITRE